MWLKARQIGSRLCWRAAGNTDYEEQIVVARHPGQFKTIVNTHPDYVYGAVARLIDSLASRAKLLTSQEQTIELQSQRISILEAEGVRAENERTTLKDQGHQRQTDLTRATKLTSPKRGRTS
jgi:hypothetical protein